MKDNFNPAEILQNITPMIEQTAEENGLIALETAFVKEAGAWTLRVFIYREDGTITHDDCQTITKALDSCLDEIITAPYRLEVSSPGLDRKLKSTKEYNIFKGKRVKVKLKNHAERGSMPFPAKIADFSEENGLTLEPLDTEGFLCVKKEEISFVKLEPEF